MITDDRLLSLCHILLGAAHADDELADREIDEVRALLQEASGGELATELEVELAGFDTAGFDLAVSVAPFADDTEDERRKLLFLVSAVIEADDELDLREDAYLRALATALKLPESALSGLTVDVETVELQETYAAVRKTAPPPVPPKAKKPVAGGDGVDIDID